MKKQASWLRLIGFLVMATLTSSLFVALVVGTAMIAAGGSDAQADDATAVPAVNSASQTFRGELTDERCGGHHMNPALTAADCARSCVRDGSHYLLIDGDKKYVVAGDQAPQFAKLSGQRVVLVGELEGNTIKVSSITQ